MIKKIKTFIRLSSARKMVVLQTIGLSFYTFLLFTFFNRYARFGKNVKATDNNTQPPDKKAGDIAWAIQVVDKYTPWKNVCRHQAYQAKLLCNYYKIPCLIFIGFKKDKMKNEIQAHAWTIAGGKIITGFCNPEEYVIHSIYKNKWQ